MNDFAEAHPTSDVSSTNTLSISLTGPFLYVFQPGHIKTTVDIYAPFCPYHEAGIFFSRASVSETDLWKCAQSHDPTLTNADRIYAVSGEGIHKNTHKPQTPTIQRHSKDKEDNIRILGVGDSSADLSPRLDKMMFGLCLPRPKYVLPLYCDKVEVVPDFKTIPSNTFSLYCTGLRFFYEWDVGTPIVLEIPTGEPVYITPPVFCELPKMADIEIRYAGLDIADQNDRHSDARSCFASLATLAGVKHWLNYGDGLGCPTNPGHASNSCPGSALDPCAQVGHLPEYHTGADCHAPIIVTGLD